MVVRATKKLQRLVGPCAARDGDRGSTLLGPWYATVLSWPRAVVLLVNERTLLPVLLPVAPATSLASRIAEEISAVLTVHQAPAAFVDRERRHMRSVQFGATANRSVVGVMTDLGRLAEIHHHDDPGVNLRMLAVRLAGTPCSPLYDRGVSPDRELAAVMREVAT